jgi:alcohol dehydrogenase
MYGSTITGFAFDNSDVTGVHCISESIGALYDVPHGVVNSIFLPHVLSYNMPYCTPKMAVLVRAAGINENDTMAAQLFVEMIQKLSDKLGIPSFKGLNIDKKEFETIEDMSYRNISTPSNPRDLEKEDYVKILEDAY